jgi:radical SAM protein with 4Fe4S-binding SPASM domain
MTKWSKLSDTMAMAGTLNVRRIFNLCWLSMGYLSYLATKRTFNPGLPFAVSIEPTTSCNLHCPECPTGMHSLTRPKGFIKMDLYRNIIDQMSSHLLYLTLYFQGEPYLHPDFHDMVAYAHSKKIYVATSTNGHYLDDANAEATIRSGLNKLIVSLDGTDQETYSSYRKGGDFDRVIAGVKRLVAWKRKLGVQHPHIIIQFLVLSTNEHQAVSIKKLGRELGADEVQIKTAQLNSYMPGNPLMPKDKRFSRYMSSPDGTFKPTGRMRNRCFRMWTSPVITWNGEVIPCCFDKDAEHKMGNVGTGNFKEIWKSPEYKKFRTQIRHSRKSAEICCNCTQRW